MNTPSKKTKTPKQSSTIFHNIMAASVKGITKPKDELIEKKQSNYSLSIEKLELPIRLKIILNKNGINTLKDLASYDVIELLQFKNIGIKYISLIEESIKKYGLKLGDFIR